ncbi:MAG: ribonuclease P protein subunit [Nitrosarchaeum sp.]|nr:ribonuclease P protein subunit [Nitrosarchaeum sp.]
MIALRIAAAEFIGGQLVVKASPNPAEQGLRGKVIDETMNTLLLSVGGRDVRIAKVGRVFVWEGAVLVGD